MRVVVAGAGGAIGGYLVAELLKQGHEVRAFDIKNKRDWWQLHRNAQNFGEIDLRREPGDEWAVNGADRVYDLAENMGGIGFITTHRVDCAESVELGISLLRACHAQGVGRFFFASSACVYNTDLQNGMWREVLREEDAWPAKPEDGYGFAKLYMEELCRHYHEERGLDVRVARYHNVYGRHSSWRDGREKAPAALCRKVATAVLADSEEIDVWGDGEQLRSYMHAQDCVEGTIALMESEHDAPINLGSDRSISVNDMIDLIAIKIGGMRRLRKNYQYTEATGVAARNADITLARKMLNWEPKVSLEDGLADLYDWIYSELRHG